MSLVRFRLWAFSLQREKIEYGSVAQVVEHLTFNQVVRGSNPRTLMKETAQFYDYRIVLFLYVVIKVTE